MSAIANTSSQLLDTAPSATAVGVLWLKSSTCVSLRSHLLLNGGMPRGAPKRRRSVRCVRHGWFDPRDIVRRQKESGGKQEGPQHVMMIYLSGRGLADEGGRVGCCCEHHAGMSPLPRNSFLGTH